MKNTAKYAWSFSRNSSFLRGLFFYAAPCSPSNVNAIFKHYVTTAVYIPLYPSNSTLTRVHNGTATNADHT